MFESKIRNEVLDSEGLYGWPPPPPDFSWEAWPNPLPHPLDPRTVKNNLQRYFGDLRPGDYVIPKRGVENHFLLERPTPQTIDVRQPVDQDQRNKMIPRRIKAMFFRQPLYRKHSYTYWDDDDQEHDVYNYRIVEFKLSFRKPNRNAEYASFWLEKKFAEILWSGDLDTEPIAMFDPDEGEFQDQTTNNLWAKNYMKVPSIVGKRTIYDPILKQNRVNPAQNIYGPNMVARETGVARRGI